MNIKTIIASSLMLMHPAYTISSEQESIDTSINENSSHTLSLPEVAITITEHSDLLEIIRLSATNKTFRNFLKEQAVTERILTQIISLYHYNLIFSYQNSLIGNLDTIVTTVSSKTGIETLTRDTQENRNNLLLSNLKSFLHEGECDFFNQALIEGFLLIDIMKQCHELNNWETCINKLTELDKTKLPRYLAHFYCKGKHKTYDILKTLLIEALCLQAPQEVIDILIQWGSRLTSTKGETPPPCLILFESLRTKNTEQDIDLFKQRIDQLIEKGANFDDYCYMPSAYETAEQTPLWCAIKSNSIELVEYALERSSQNAINNHMELAFSLMNRIKPEIIKLLIGSGRGTIINQWFLAIFDAYLKGGEDSKERCLEFLQTLLSHEDVDVNYSDFGVTPLYVIEEHIQKGVNPNEYNQKLVELLIEKGATKESIYSLEQLKLLSQLKEQLSNACSIFILHQRGQETLEAFAQALIATLQVANPVIGMLNSEIMPTIIGLTIEAIGTDAETMSIEFLKQISRECSLCFPQVNGDTATSVYQLLVYALNNIKSQAPHDAYLALEKKVLFIFEELAKAEIEDKAEGNSRLAIHLAQEYDLPEVVNCLRNSLYSKD